MANTSHNNNNKLLQPYDLPSFITRTTDLIQHEYNEEIEYHNNLINKLNTLQLQQIGLLLTNLTVSDIHTGLYGRQLITLSNRKGLSTSLKTHKFTIRDVVSIVPYNAIHDKNAILCNGTVYKVTDTYITISIDDKNSDNNDVNYETYSNLCILQQTNDITYKRYNNILQQLNNIQNKQDNTSNNILNVLYNNIQPTQTSHTMDFVPYSNKLNDIQLQAIQKCLQSNDVYMIHGRM